MTLFQAIVLGVVQGLTEFLPISSTAHLALVPALFCSDDPGAAFSAVIQIGTLAAVVWYFRGDIVRIARAMIVAAATGRPLESHDARLGWMIALATVPIVVAGLLFKQQITTTLRSLYVIAGSLILLAIVLGLAEMLAHRRVRAGFQQQELADATWGDAVLLGCGQALALVPGVSRSGITLTWDCWRACRVRRRPGSRFCFRCRQFSRPGCTSWSTSGMRSLPLSRKSSTCSPPRQSPRWSAIWRSRFCSDFSRRTRRGFLLVTGSHWVHCF